MEDDRRQKVEAAKQTLAKYRKKKTRQTKISQTNDSASEISATELPSSIIDPDDEKESVISPRQGIAIVEEMDQMSGVFRLDESLRDRQSLLGNLVEENERLRAQVSQLESAGSDIIRDLPVPEREVLDSLDGYSNKLKEFEEALARRDEVIGILSSKLRKVTENRDALQVEYTSQANQLMQQVHLLQHQLKQAGNWLHLQDHSSSTQALLEAKNELLALHENCRQKENQLIILQNIVHERETTLQQIIVRVNETTRDFAQIHEENRKLKEQLEMTEAEVTLLRAEQNTLRTDSGSVEKESAMMLLRLQQENEVLRRKDQENVEVVRQLMADVENRHKDWDAAAPSKTPDSIPLETSFTKEELEVEVEKQLNKLRAELDEIYGTEIGRMKEHLQDKHRSELDRLNVELKRTADEKNRFSGQVELWQQQYVRLSQQNVSSTDLVEQLSAVVSENIQQKQLIEELRTQLKALTDEQTSRTKLDERNSAINVTAEGKPGQNELISLENSIQALREHTRTLEGELSAVLEERDKLLANVRNLQSELEFSRKTLSEAAERHAHERELLQKEAADDIQKLGIQLSEYESHERLLESQNADHLTNSAELSRTRELLGQAQLDHTDQLATLKIEYEKYVLELKSYHQAELETMSQQHTWKINELQSVVKTQQDEQMELVRRQLDEAERMYLAQLENFQKGKEEALKQGAEQFQKQMDEMRENLVQEHSREILERIEEVKLQYEQTISALRQDYEMTVAQLNDQLSGTKPEREILAHSAAAQAPDRSSDAVESLQVTISDLSTKLKKVTKERDSAMQSLQTVYSDRIEMKQTLDQMNSEKEHLLAKMDRMTEERQVAETQLSAVCSERDGLRHLLDRRESGQAAAATVEASSCVPLVVVEPGTKKAREQLDAIIRERKALQHLMLSNPEERSSAPLPSGLDQSPDSSQFSLVDQLRFQFEDLKLRYSHEIRESKEYQVVLLERIENLLQENEMLRNLTESHTENREQAASALSRQLTELTNRCSLLSSELEERNHLIEKLQLSQGVADAEHNPHLDMLLKENDALKLEITESRQKLNDRILYEEAEKERARNLSEECLTLKLKLDTLETLKLELTEKQNWMDELKAAYETSRTESSKNIKELSEECSTLRLQLVESQKNVNESRRQLSALALDAQPVSPIQKTPEKLSADVTHVERGEALEMDLAEFLTLKQEYALVCSELFRLREMLSSLQTANKEREDVRVEFERQIAMLRKELLCQTYVPVPGAARSLEEELKQKENELQDLKNQLSKALGKMNELLIERDAQQSDYENELEQIRHEHAEALRRIDALVQEHNIIFQGFSSSSFGPVSVEVMPELTDQNIEEEPSPRKVVYETQSLEIAHLRNELLEALGHNESLSTENNALRVKLESASLDFLRNIDEANVESKREKEALEKLIANIRTELTQSNYKFECVSMENEHLVASQRKELDRLSSDYEFQIKGLMSRIEEMNADRECEVASSKKRLAELQGEVERIRLEKVNLEQEFVSEMQNMYKEHEIRIKNVRDSYEQEIESLQQELARQMEETTARLEDFDGIRQQNTSLLNQLEQLLQERDWTKARQSEEVQAEMTQSEKEAALLIRLDVLNREKAALRNELDLLKDDYSSNFDELEKAQAENKALRRDLSLLNEAKVEGQYDVGAEMTQSEKEAALLIRLDVLDREKAALRNELDLLKDDYSSNFDELEKAQAANKALRRDLSLLNEAKVHGQSDMGAQKNVLSNEALMTCSSIDDSTLKDIDDNSVLGDPHIKMLSKKVRSLQMEKELLASMVERLNREKEKLVSYLVTRSHLDEAYEIDMSHLDLQLGKNASDSGAGTDSRDPRLRSLEMEKELLVGMLEKLSQENERLAAHFSTMDMLGSDHESVEAGVVNIGSDLSLYPEVDVSGIIAREEKQEAEGHVALLQEELSSLKEENERLKEKIIDYEQSLAMLNLELQNKDMMLSEVSKKMMVLSEQPKPEYEQFVEEAQIVNQDTLVVAPSGDSDCIKEILSHNKQPDSLSSATSDTDMVDSNSSKEQLLAEIVRLRSMVAIAEYKNMEEISLTNKEVIEPENLQSSSDDLLQKGEVENSEEFACLKNEHQIVVADLSSQISQLKSQQDAIAYEIKSLLQEFVSVDLSAIPEHLSLQVTDLPEDGGEQVSLSNLIQVLKHAKSVVASIMRSTIEAQDLSLEERRSRIDVLMEEKGKLEKELASVRNQLLEVLPVENMVSVDSELTVGLLIGQVNRIITEKNDLEEARSSLEKEKVESVATIGHLEIELERVRSLYAEAEEKLSVKHKTMEETSSNGDETMTSGKLRVQESEHLSPSEDPRVEFKLQTAEETAMETWGNEVQMTERLDDVLSTEIQPSEESGLEEKKEALELKNLLNEMRTEKTLFELELKSVSRQVKDLSSRLGRLLVTCTGGQEAENQVVADLLQIDEAPPSMEVRGLEEDNEAAPDVQGKIDMGTDILELCSNVDQVLSRLSESESANWKLTTKLQEAEIRSDSLNLRVTEFEAIVASIKRESTALIQSLEVRVAELEAEKDALYSVSDEQNLLATTVQDELKHLREVDEERADAMSELKMQLEALLQEKQQLAFELSVVRLQMEGYRTDLSAARRSDELRVEMVVSEKRAMSGEELTVEEMNAKDATCRAGMETITERQIKVEDVESKGLSSFAGLQTMTEQQVVVRDLTSEAGSKVDIVAFDSLPAIPSAPEFTVKIESAADSASHAELPSDFDKSQKVLSGEDESGKEVPVTVVERGLMVLADIENVEVLDETAQSESIGMALEYQDVEQSHFSDLISTTSHGIEEVSPKVAETNLVFTAEKQGVKQDAEVLFVEMQSQPVTLQELKAIQELVAVLNERIETQDRALEELAELGNRSQQDNTEDTVLVDQLRTDNLKLIDQLSTVQEELFNIQTNLERMTEEKRLLEDQLLTQTHRFDKAFEESSRTVHERLEDGHELSVEVLNLKQLYVESVATIDELRRELEKVQNLKSEDAVDRGVSDVASQANSVFIEQREEELQKLRAEVASLADDYKTSLETIQKLQQQLEEEKTVKAAELAALHQTISEGSDHTCEIQPTFVAHATVASVSDIDETGGIDKLTFVPQTFCKGQIPSIYHTTTESQTSIIGQTTVANQTSIDQTISENQLAITLQATNESQTMIVDHATSESQTTLVHYATDESQTSSIDYATNESQTSVDQTINESQTMIVDHVTSESQTTVVHYATGESQTTIVDYATNESQTSVDLTISENHLTVIPQATNESQTMIVDHVTSESQTTVVHYATDESQTTSVDYATNESQTSVDQTISENELTIIPQATNESQTMTVDHVTSESQTTVVHYATGESQTTSVVYAAKESQTSLDQAIRESQLISVFQTSSEDQTTGFSNARTESQTAVIVNYATAESQTSIDQTVNENQITTMSLTTCQSPTTSTDNIASESQPTIVDYATGESLSTTLVHATTESQVLGEKKTADKSNTMRYVSFEEFQNHSVTLLELRAIQELVAVLNERIEAQDRALGELAELGNRSHQDNAEKNVLVEQLKKDNLKLIDELCTAQEELSRIHTSLEHFTEEKRLLEDQLLTQKCNFDKVAEESARTVDLLKMQLADHETSVEVLNLKEQHVESAAVIDELKKQLEEVKKLKSEDTLISGTANIEIQDSSVLPEQCEEEKSFSVDQLRTDNVKLRAELCVIQKELSNIQTNLECMTDEKRLLEDQLLTKTYKSDEVVEESTTTEDTLKMQREGDHEQSIEVLNLKEQLVESVTIIDELKKQLEEFKKRKSEDIGTANIEIQATNVLKEQREEETTTLVDHLRTENRKLIIELGFVQEELCSIKTNLEGITEEKKLLEDQLLTQTSRFDKAVEESARTVGELKKQLDCGHELNIEVLNLKELYVESVATIDELRKQLENVQKLKSEDVALEKVDGRMKQEYEDGQMLPSLNPPLNFPPFGFLPAISCVPEFTVKIEPAADSTTHAELPSDFDKSQKVLSCEDESGKEVPVTVVERGLMVLADIENVEVLDQIAQAESIGMALEYQDVEQSHFSTSSCDIEKVSPKIAETNLVFTAEKQGVKQDAEVLFVEMQSQPVTLQELKAIQELVAELNERIETQDRALGELAELGNRSQKDNTENTVLVDQLRTDNLKLIDELCTVQEELSNIQINLECMTEEKRLLEDQLLTQTHRYDKAVEESSRTVHEQLEDGHELNAEMLKKLYDESVATIDELRRELEKVQNLKSEATVDLGVTEVVSQATSVFIEQREEEYQSLKAETASLSDSIQTTNDAQTSIVDQSAAERKTLGIKQTSVEIQTSVDMTAGQSQTTSIDHVSAESQTATVDLLADENQKGFDETLSEHLPITVAQTASECQTTVVDLCTAKSQTVIVDHDATESQTTIIDYATIESQTVILDYTTTESQTVTADHPATESQTIIVDYATTESQTTIEDHATTESQTTTIDYAAIESQTVIVDYATTESQTTIIDHGGSESQTSSVDHATGKGLTTFMDQNTADYINRSEYSQCTVIEQTTVHSQATAVDHITAEGQSITVDDGTVEHQGSVEAQTLNREDRVDDKPDVQLAYRKLQLVVTELTEQNHENQASISQLTLENEKLKAELSLMLHKTEVESQISTEGLIAVETQILSLSQNAVEQPRGETTQFTAESQMTAVDQTAVECPTTREGQTTSENQTTAESHSKGNDETAIGEGKTTAYSQTEAASHMVIESPTTSEGQVSAESQSTLIAQITIENQMESHRQITTQSQTTGEGEVTVASQTTGMGQVTAGSQTTGMSLVSTGSQTTGEGQTSTESQTAGIAQTTVDVQATDESGTASERQRLVLDQSTGGSQMVSQNTVGSQITGVDLTSTECQTTVVAQKTCGSQTVCIDLKTVGTQAKIESQAKVESEITIPDLDAAIVRLDSSESLLHVTEAGSLVQPDGSAFDEQLTLAIGKGASAIISDSHTEQDLHRRIKFLEEALARQEHDFNEVSNKLSLVTSQKQECDATLEKVEAEFVEQMKLFGDELAKSEDCKDKIEEEILQNDEEIAQAADLEQKLKAKVQELENDPTDAVSQVKVESGTTLADQAAVVVQLNSSQCLLHVAEAGSLIQPDGSAFDEQLTLAIGKGASAIISDSHTEQDLHRRIKFLEEALARQEHDFNEVSNKLSLVTSQKQECDATLEKVEAKFVEQMKLLRDDLAKSEDCRDKIEEEVRLKVEELAQAADLEQKLKTKVQELENDLTMAVSHSKVESETTLTDQATGVVRLDSSESLLHVTEAGPLVQPDGSAFDEQLTLAIGKGASAIIRSSRAEEDPQRRIKFLEEALSRQEHEFNEGLFEMNDKLSLVTSQKHECDATLEKVEARFVEQVKRLGDELAKSEDYKAKVEEEIRLKIEELAQAADLELKLKTKVQELDEDLRSRRCIVEELEQAVLELNTEREERIVTFTNSEAELTQKMKGLEDIASQLKADCKSLEEELKSKEEFVEKLVKVEQQLRNKIAQMEEELVEKCNKQDESANAMGRLTEEGPSLTAGKVDQVKEMQEEKDLLEHELTQLQKTVQHLKTNVMDVEESARTSKESLLAKDVELMNTLAEVEEYQKKIQCLEETIMTLRGDVELREETIAEKEKFFRAEVEEKQNIIRESKSKIDDIQKSKEESLAKHIELEEKLSEKISELLKERESLTSEKMEQAKLVSELSSKLSIVTDERDQAAKDWKSEIDELRLKQESGESKLQSVIEELTSAKEEIVVIQRNLASAEENLATKANELQSIECTMAKDRERFDSESQSLIAQIKELEDVLKEKVESVGMLQGAVEEKKLDLVTSQEDSQNLLKSLEMYQKEQRSLAEEHEKVVVDLKSKAAAAELDRDETVRRCEQRESEILARVEELEKSKALHVQQLVAMKQEYTGVIKDLRNRLDVAEEEKMRILTLGDNTKRMAVVREMVEREIGVSASGNEGMVLEKGSESVDQGTVKFGGEFQRSTGDASFGADQADSSNQTRSEVESNVSGKTSELGLDRTEGEVLMKDLSAELLFTEVTDVAITKEIRRLEENLFDMKLQHSTLLRQLKATQEELKASKGEKLEMEKCIKKLESGKFEADQQSHTLLGANEQLSSQVACLLKDKELLETKVAELLLMCRNVDEAANTDTERKETGDQKELVESIRQLEHRIDELSQANEVLVTENEFISDSMDHTEGCLKSAGFDNEKKEFEYQRQISELESQLLMASEESEKMQQTYEQQITNLKMRLGFETQSPVQAPTDFSRSPDTTAMEFESAKLWQENLVLSENLKTCQRKIEQLEAQLSALSGDGTNLETAQDWVEKIKKLEEQHETELAILKFRLTESHGNEVSHLRSEVVTELSEAHRKREEQLRTEFEQSLEAFKVHYQHKCIEEFSKAKKEWEQTQSQVRGDLSDDQPIHLQAEDQLVQELQKEIKDMTDSRLHLLNELDACRHQYESVQEENSHLLAQVDQLHSALSRRQSPGDLQHDYQGSPKFIPEQDAEEWRLRLVTLLDRGASLEGSLFSSGLLSPSSRSGSESVLVSDDGLPLGENEDSAPKNVNPSDLKSPCFEERHDWELVTPSVRRVRDSTEGSRANALWPSVAEQHPIPAAQLPDRAAVGNDVYLDSLSPLDGMKTEEDVNRSPIYDGDRLRTTGFIRESSSETDDMTARRLGREECQKMKDMSDQLEPVDFGSRYKRIARDHSSLQFEYEQFKAKARKEYARLKNRLIVTVKEFNDFKVKHSNVGVLEAEISTLQNQVTVLDLVIQELRSAQRMEKEQAVTETQISVPSFIIAEHSRSGKQRGQELTDGMPPDVRKMTEKITTMELELDVLRSQCSMLAQKNVSLEQLVIRYRSTCRQTSPLVRSEFVKPSVDRVGDETSLTESSALKDEQSSTQTLTRTSELQTTVLDDRDRVLSSENRQLTSKIQEQKLFYESKLQSLERKCTQLEKQVTRFEETSGSEACRLCSVLQAESESLKLQNEMERSVAKTKLEELLGRFLQLEAELALERQRSENETTRMSVRLCFHILLVLISAICTTLMDHNLNC